MLDGKKIIVALTGLDVASQNRKLGPGVLQTWYLPAEETPLTAMQTGADASVCGNCSLRGVNGKGRSCYVNLVHGPQNIYRSYRVGTMKRFQGDEIKAALRGRIVRFGAWGDPVSAPVDLTRWLAGMARAPIGYTHQWRTCDEQFQQYLMASVNNADEALEAQERGWATFRVRTPDEPRLIHEKPCPAADESNHATTCSECLKCRGVGAETAYNVVINVHGNGKKNFRGEA